MSPCATSYSSSHHSQSSEKDSIKLGKPVVEKIRRDRINSCIEQLKIILGKEFLNQEPNSKLEKADILEMTVSFLRQRLRPNPRQSNYNLGYSHCWRDSLHFLSADSNTQPPPLQCLQQQQQLLQVQRARSSSLVRTTLRLTVLQHSGSRSPVWRPW